MSTIVPPGTYPLNGSFTSPAGYIPDVRPGTLTVLPRPVTTPPDLPPLWAETSYIYDRNLGSPYVCLGSGTFTSGLGLPTGSDLLDFEWARVRSKPQINSCLSVPVTNSCSDF